MAAITLEMVAAWLQQRNREGQASAGNGEGQANTISMGTHMENSSSELSPPLLEQPHSSQIGDVSHAPWVPLSQTSFNLFASTMGMDMIETSFNVVGLNTNNINYNGYSEDEDIYESDDEYDEVSSDNSIYTPTSVLSPTLASILGTTDDTSDNEGDVNNGDASASTPISNVVVGCRICSVFIMVPGQTNVCPQCGHGNLVRFDGSLNI